MNYVLQQLKNACFIIKLKHGYLKNSNYGKACNIQIPYSHKPNRKRKKSIYFFVHKLLCLFRKERLNFRLVQSLALWETFWGVQLSFSEFDYPYYDG